MRRKVALWGALASAALLLCASPAAAVVSVSIATSKAETNTSNAIKLTSDATTADIPVGTLVVFMCVSESSSSSVDTPEDSTAANSWGTGTLFTLDNAPTRYFWSVTTTDLPIGSTFSCTFNNASGRKSMVVYAVSGVTGMTTATVHDASPTGATNPGSSSVALPAFTPSNASSLVFVTTTTYGGSNTLTETAGFTSIGDVTWSLDTNHGSYLVTTTTASITYTATLSAAKEWTSVPEVFKLSGGSPPATKKRGLLLGVGE